jgi:hypothetical protein
VKSKNNLISSNVIINPGNYEYYEHNNSSFTGKDAYVMFQLRGTSVSLTNNYLAREAGSAGFASLNMLSPDDFALVESSPLIDAADANPKAEVSFDFRHHPRPHGSRSDIGAFEQGVGNTIKPGEAKTEAEKKVHHTLTDKTRKTKL